MSEKTLEELADKMNGGPDLTPEEWDRVIAALREHAECYAEAVGQGKKDARIAELEKALRDISRLENTEAPSVIRRRALAALEERDG